MDRNFVGVRYIPEIDRSLFLDDDVLEALDPAWTNLAQLLAHIKMFPSVTQAKKNGFDRPLPLGWFQMRLPKRIPGTLTIWNPATTTSFKEQAEEDEKERAAFDSWKKLAKAMTPAMKALAETLNRLEELEFLKPEDARNYNDLEAQKLRVVDCETSEDVREFGRGYVRFQ